MLITAPPLSPPPPRADLTLSCYIPGLLATVSSDRTVKVWDIHDDKPAFLWAKDLKVVRAYISLCGERIPALLFVGVGLCTST